MRRFRQTLLNAATVASLVLCAATVVLWVRSKSNLDEIEYATAHRCVYLRSVNSLIVLSRIDSTLASKPTGWGYTSRELDLIAGLGTSGFSDTAITVTTTKGTYSERSWAVPFWAVIATMLTLPIGVVLRRRLWGERRRPGLCPSCGYDLRAMPDRCPECGHALERVRT